MSISYANDLVLVPLDHGRLLTNAEVVSHMQVDKEAGGVQKNVSR